MFKADLPHSQITIKIKGGGRLSNQAKCLVRSLEIQGQGEDRENMTPPICPEMHQAGGTALAHGPAPPLSEVFSHRKENRLRPRYIMRT